MAGVVVPDFETIADNEIIVLGVKPYPPQPSAARKVGYIIAGAFRDAKDRTLRRVKLFVAAKIPNAISQDGGNLAQYYLNKVTLPKFMRKRYALLVKPDGDVSVRKPDGQMMPEKDVQILTYHFS